MSEVSSNVGVYSNAADTWSNPDIGISQSNIKYKSFSPLIHRQPSDLCYIAENSRAPPRKGTEPKPFLFIGDVGHETEAYSKPGEESWRVQDSTRINPKPALPVKETPAYTITQGIAHLVRASSCRSRTPLGGRGGEWYTPSQSPALAAPRCPPSVLNSLIISPFKHDQTMRPKVKFPVSPAAVLKQDTINENVEYARAMITRDSGPLAQPRKPRLLKARLRPLLNEVTVLGPGINQCSGIKPRQKPHGGGGGGGGSDDLGVWRSRGSASSSAVRSGGDNQPVRQLHSRPPLAPQASVDSNSGDNPAGKLYPAAGCSGSARIPFPSPAVPLHGGYINEEEEDDVREAEDDAREAEDDAREVDSELPPLCSPVHISLSLHPSNGNTRTDPTNESTDEPNVQSGPLPTVNEDRIADVESALIHPPLQRSCSGTDGASRGVTFLTDRRSESPTELKSAQEQQVIDKTPQTGEE